MSNLILFGLLIVLLIVAQFATAKTVDEIIEKYMRARGGKDKLASLKSIYMEGIKEVMGEKLAVRIIKEQDRLSRTEIETENANSFVLVTDKEAWTFFSVKSPDAHQVPGEAMEGFIIETDIAGPLADYIGKGYKAELLGKELVEDNSCYKIKLTAKAGKEMLFWVDANTFLVNQSSGATDGIEGTRTLMVHKDYKEVGGIQFAHTFEPKNNKMNEGELSGEIHFHTIIVNPPIDPKMYLPVSANISR